ncbi:MAG: AbrB family transcriptional regulator [Anaerolineae bacterium]|nr:AbrB family transcriptional regulator [Anaerolineae bacterium]
MTIVVKSTDEDAISLPAGLMAVLNLREGDAIKAIVDGQTLRLARLDKFLALRGILADDEAFDRALASIDRAWKSWTIPISA